mgnify:FL=1|tara:strand:- start:653 stop:1129 length:477 start_codon:yes stop_codon:yes gene_type:complete
MSRNPYGDNKPKAFTLIEVLIALALFALASSIIASAFINALLARENNPSITYKDIATQTARNQLLLEPDKDSAEEGTTIEALEIGEITWTSEILATDIVDLFECRISIEFLDLDSNAASSYRETLYLLRPTWSESDERSSLLQVKKDALIGDRDFNSF